MEVVTDASAVLAVALGEPERERLVAATRGVTLLAPQALPWEIGNALTAMHKRGRIDEETLFPAWRATQQIPVQLVPVEMEAALALALEQGIYAYDAYYLHCSLSHRRPLVTLDRKMREVAEDLKIRLLV
jgi:predicted nucleic acid-binding protein